VRERCRKIESKEMKETEKDIDGEKKLKRERDKLTDRQKESK
jgi:hypothetical protein